MITIRKPRAKERSTYVISMKFKDETGEDAVPTAIKWTLCDENSNPINGRKDVEVLVPANEIDVVLKGDDLQILEGEKDQETVQRYVVIEATYNSTLGTGLPLNEVAMFELTNFLYIGE